MGERRRHVVAVTAAAVLLLGACGGDDAGDTLETAPTSVADTDAITSTTLTTSTDAITSTTATPANTTAAPATTTATTTAVTTVPETTTGALVLSWTSSGPPASGCFAPGETVPDLVVERSPDSEPFNFQVDIIDWQFEPLTVAPLSWTADYSDDRIVLTFTVDEAPRPWSVELVLGYSVQGTQVFVTDEPEVFRWSFEDACG